MKSSFQITAYILLMILGFVVIINDGDIIYCIRCGSMIRDLLASVSVVSGAIGLIGIAGARSKAAANAKG